MLAKLIIAVAGLGWNCFCATDSGAVRALWGSTNTAINRPDLLELRPQRNCFDSAWQSTRVFAVFAARRFGGECRPSTSRFGGPSQF